MSRMPSTIASVVGSRREIALRLAHPADDAAVARLAELAGRHLTGRPLLVAEVDGQLVAVADEAGEVLGDPFRVTVDVAELLRVRVAQLRRAAA
jgi:hypothetical protein